MDMGYLLHAKSLQIYFLMSYFKANILGLCVWKEEVWLWCVWYADQAKTMAGCLLWHSVII